MRNEPPISPAMAMQFWQDMARMWMGYMIPFMPGAIAPLTSSSPWDLGVNPRPPGPPPAPPPAASPRSAPAQRLPEVEVTTARAAQVQVSLDVQTGAFERCSHLVAIAHSIDGGKPALPACRFSSRAGSPKVEVSVPMEQPAGTYVGAVLDREQNRALGTVTIIIGYSS